LDLIALLRRFLTALMKGFGLYSFFSPFFFRCRPPYLTRPRHSLEMAGVRSSRRFLTFEGAPFYAWTPFALSPLFFLRRDQDLLFTRGKLPSEVTHESVLLSLLIDPSCSAPQEGVPDTSPSSFMFLPSPFGEGAFNYSTLGSTRQIAFLPVPYSSFFFGQRPQSSIATVFRLMI